MKRKEFLAKGIIGLSGFAVLTTVLGHRVKEGTEDCEVSPMETKGPFPNKTPSALVRESIIGNRRGIALRIDLKILNKNNDCGLLADAVVDVWHCDSQGKYSEYGDNWLQSEDMTQTHFLRGRQISDAQGKVSFISIYPGYYRGRAPHIHLEVCNADQKSLLVTQIAFPMDICDAVYATEFYQGTDYVSNTSDGVFRNSLEHNMADGVVGNVKDGFTLSKSIVVDA